MTDITTLTVEQAHKIAKAADAGGTMADAALSISLPLDQFETIPQAVKIYHEYYGLALIKLRQAQMDKALDGDGKMLIFLGKNLLGQSDNPTLADAASKLASTFSDLSDSQLADRIKLMESELRADA